MCPIILFSSFTLSLSVIPFCFRWQTYTSVDRATFGLSDLPRFTRSFICKSCHPIHRSLPLSRFIFYSAREISVKRRSFMKAEFKMSFVSKHTVWKTVLAFLQVYFNSYIFIPQTWRADRFTF